MKNDSRRMGLSIAIFTLTLLLAGVVPNARAVSYHVATDVPPLLGEQSFTTGDVLLSQDGEYTVAQSFPFPVDIGAIHRRDNGDWLFVPVDTVTLGPDTFSPRDVVAYDGVVFSLYFDGDASGIPERARIDALFLEADTFVVISVDGPVLLGGSPYSASDLVKHDGTFSLYWDAEGPGVEIGANVAGADLDDQARLVLTFVDPTDAGGTVYRSGDLISWDGAAFGLYFRDPDWDPTALIEGIHVIDSSGSGDADGDFYPTSIDCNDADPDLWATPGEARELLFASDKQTLGWSEPQPPGGAATSLSYGLLRSEAADDFVTNPVVCFNAAGSTSATDPQQPAPGGPYFYLARATNACGQGSLGLSSSGGERAGQACP